MWRRSGAVLRHELRILRRDPAPIALNLVMPLLFFSFLKPAFRPALVQAGYSDASGAEHVIPGTTVLFAFFLVTFTGYSFYREQQWGTWDRLRASPVRASELLLGKAIPGLCTVTLQFTLGFGVGRIFYGLRLPSAWPALVVLCLTFGVFLVSLSVVFVALCRTYQQLNAVSTLAAVMFAGLGGAITPTMVLPGWARSVAPLTPSYWAMRGFRSLFLDNAQGSAVILPIVVLASASVVLATIGTFSLAQRTAKMQ